MGFRETNTSVGQIALEDGSILYTIPDLADAVLWSSVAEEQ
jgi:hypothetical protein